MRTNLTFFRHLAAATALDCWREFWQWVGRKCDPAGEWARVTGIYDEGDE